MTTSDNSSRYPYLTGITIGKLLELLLRERFRVDRKHLGSVLRIGMYSLATGFLSMLEKRAGRGISEEARASMTPLFILGHWRSGTTHLFRLLCSDPRHTAPSTYSSTFPSCFIIGGTWLKEVARSRAPKQRPFDNMSMGLDHPLEEEFALMKTTLTSPMLGAVFPRSTARYEAHADIESLPQRQRRLWCMEMVKFISKVSSGTGKRLILKSPANTFRVALLRRLSPRARFVFIARDPYVVFCSTRKLMRSLYEHNAVHSYDHIDIDSGILRNYIRMFDSLEESRKDIPPGHLAELRFEELESSPIETIERMYRELDLGDYAEARPHIEKYLEDLGPHQKNSYSLADEDRKRVGEEWRRAFETYGYDL